MKKFIVSIIFCLATYGFAFTQSKFPELKKIKQIKLLESTREDVKRIFADYKVEDRKNSNGFDFTTFSTKYYDFGFYYSTGNCTNENEDWNVPEGTVNSIRIFFKKSINPEYLGINLSSLRKEKMFVNSSEDFIYHDKTVGINYDVCNAGANRIGEISYIEIFPAKEKVPLLCSNKTETKKFYERKKWSDEKSQKPTVRYFANVNKMTLDSSEVIADCDSDDWKDVGNCSDSKQIKILVDAEASVCTSWDFTYNYTITGGKIIGMGASVVWDLSGVKPGSYTITAGVDNGCGVCGTTKTETVVVKEPDCPKPQPK